MNPDLLTALLIVFAAALLGGLAAWLWMRLQIKALENHILILQSSQEEHEKQQAQKEQELKKQQTDFQSLKKAFDSQQSHLEEEITAKNNLTKELETAQKRNRKLAESNQDLQKDDNQTQPSDSDLQKLHQEIDQLQKLLAAEGKKRKTAEKELQNTKRKPHSEKDLTAQIQKMEAAQNELQEELTEAAKREARWHQEITQLQEELDRLRNQKPQQGKSPEPFSNGQVDNKERDDLKKINGIGPVIERKLHELKIYYYSQIAQLDEAQQERLNTLLGPVPGRVQRDSWVEQARYLWKVQQNKEKGS